eukprot:780184-Rhodomonas_salina.3
MTVGQLSTWTCHGSLAALCQWHRRRDCQCGSGSLGSQAPGHSARGSGWLTELGPAPAAGKLPVEPEG